MALLPSQRLDLIKEICSRLAEEDWSITDLTLKQFGLPWNADWHGSKQSYLIEMLSDGTEEALIQLGDYLGYKIGGASTSSSIEAEFWLSGRFRLFISHLATHRAYASELKKGLHRYGFSCFVAHNDIEPTKEWQTQIELALATCDALIALLHPDFHKSNWTDQEIGYVMGRGAAIFSVRLGSDPYGFIGRFQAFNGNGKSVVDLSEELFSSFLKNKQTSDRLSGVLVSLFEESGSFAQAKERIGFLEELPAWHSSFSNRLREAEKSNSQISESWGVSNRISALIGRWS